MESRNGIAKLTIELPKVIHQRLKLLSIASNTTMRDLIVESMPDIEKRAKKIIKKESKETQWLFEPKNAKILKEVKKSLKETKLIDRGSFKKYV